MAVESQAVLIVTVSTDGEMQFRLFGDGAAKEMCDQIVQAVRAILERVASPPADREPGTIFDKAGA